MLDLTHNNYTRSYYNDIFFKVEIDPISRPVKSFYEETIIALEILYSKKIGQFYVLYSGGKDSEYILNVCLALGFNVKPVIFSTKYNQHDIKYALDFCNANRIQPQVFELDYDKFISSDEFLEIFHIMNSSCYYYAVNCHFLPKIDGTIISGESSPWLKKGKNNDNWYYYEPEACHKVADYYTNKKIHGSPFALCYTAEQYFSFLLDPAIVNLVNNKIPGKDGSDTSKIHVYNNQEKFSIMDRPKYHGCELVEKSEIFNHPNMLEVRKKHSKYWRACFLEYNNFKYAMENNQTVMQYNSDICDF